VITAGIDAGARTMKAVVVRDGRIIGKAASAAGTDTQAAANAVYDEALKAAGASRDDVEKVAATGAGRGCVSFAHDRITEVTAAARGAHAVLPDARTIIDIGAEEGRAVRMDDNGRIVDFAVNEKCAAGAGVFVEAMARALEVGVEELGELSLTSTRSVPLSAQCAVFAESEVVTLVHANTPTEDIARAVLDAISGRLASLVRRIGISGQVALVGGMARNAGFAEALRRALEIDKLLIPDEPEFTGALGAAVSAAGE
jgi:benzoyl-CoA reductase subunit D